MIRTLRSGGKGPVSDQLSHRCLRSPVATRGNACDIVNLQHSGAIGLNVGEVLGVFLGFVDHVPVGWIRVGEEIPSAEIGEPISERQLEGRRDLNLLEKRLALVFVLQLEFVGP